MEDLKKYVSQNRTLVWCGLAALMFIFAAFCPLLGIKAKIEIPFNGFDVLFGMSIENHSVEVSVFSKILLALMLLAPIYLIWETAKNSHLPDTSNRNLPFIICGACFVAGLIFMITTKKAVFRHDDISLSSFSGMYLYLIASFIGAIVAYNTKDEVVAESDDPVDAQAVATDEQNKLSAENQQFEGIKKFVNKNRTLTWSAIGGLMLIFGMFCTAIVVKINLSDILGGFGGGFFDFEQKTQEAPISCWDVLSSDIDIFGDGDTDMEGVDISGLGMPTFLMVLMLLMPIALILTTVLKSPAIESRKEKLPLMLCGASVVLGLLFMITLGDIKVETHEVDDFILPKLNFSLPMEVGYGIYLYVVTAIAGAAMAYISKKK